MLALRLPPDIEQRLDALAKKTGRSKSYYAREAILRQLEDIEDYYLARRRLARSGSRVTLESLERDLKGRTKRSLAPFGKPRADAAPVWRVEFDRAAARDLRKLGIEAERRVLRYLRERIAGATTRAASAMR